jgi:Type II secretion system (T2SS), protein G
MKPPWATLVIVTTMLVGCHVITPVEMTHTAITETFVRIHLSMQKDGEVPRSLDVIPRRESYANRTTDGWGRELEYSISDDGILTLKSLGRDGKIGGTGEGTDISKSYRTIDEDGNSLVGQDHWIVTAEVKNNSEQDGGGQPATRPESK